MLSRKAWRDIQEAFAAAETETDRLAALARRGRLLGPVALGAFGLGLALGLLLGGRR